MIEFAAKPSVPRLHCGYAVGSVPLKLNGASGPVTGQARAYVLRPTGGGTETPGAPWDPASAGAVAREALA